MVATWSLLLHAAILGTASCSSFAAAGRGRRKGGGGFGARPPPPPPIARPRQGNGSPGRGNSLERKLRKQHVENCAKAVDIWTVCSDGDPSSYDGDWQAYDTPHVAPHNEPYGEGAPLLFRSKAPLLSSAVCDALIAQMEAHGTEHGWDARYPVDGFTREVSVVDIPESVALLNEALGSTLLPEAAANFPSIALSSLRVNEALVVKYDAATGNNCLPVHTDFALITVNVALSDDSSFGGGGTWFQHSAETVRARRGEAVIHAGGLPHCGVPVSTGSRVQLVLFLLSTAHPQLDGRLQAIGAAAGAKAASELMDIELSNWALDAAVRANPLDGESWRQLAHNRRHTGDASGAVDAFERVIQLSADRDFGALCSLAAVHSEQGRPEEALDALQRAITLGAPPSPSAPADLLDAQHNAGMALMQMGRLEDAGLVFEAVVNDEPDSAESWSALGVCMTRLEQPDAALACQRQVLRIRGGGMRCECTAPAPSRPRSTGVGLSTRAAGGHGRSAVGGGAYAHAC